MNSTCGWVRWARVEDNAAVETAAGAEEVAAADDEEETAVYAAGVTAVYAEG